MIRSSLLLTVLVIVTCPSATAGIVSLDDAVFGADSITRDTAQGLDFLDLTFATTRNRSFNDVSSQFGVGGDFEGFRYATELEVINLVNNFGFSPGAQTGSLIFGDTGTDQLSGLVTLLGPTGTSGVLTESTGLTSTLDGTDQRFIRIRDVFASDDLVASDFAVSQTFSDASFASFLVRDVTAVPEPSSICLFASAATLLPFARRRRRQSSK